MIDRILPVYIGYPKDYLHSDTALEKLVYLAYRNIRDKWTMPLANWALISQQLAIKFGERFEIM